MLRALRLVWLAVLLTAAPLFSQSIIERLITPGPLSNAHARLEAKCDSCHASFKKEAQNGKCTACHSGIGADVVSGTHFHGKFAPARGSACKSCHTEHKGRGAALVRLDRAGFNHAFTDYALTGGHARVQCAGCHRPGSHFRGTPRECAQCHAAKDPHRGQLGRTCQTCHSTAGWKQVLPFDHARTGFALSGSHRTVACLTCHAGQRWKGLPDTCISCHARDDAHRGSRGTNCASCHATTAWKAVTFDHGSTGFPLVGGHATATCSACHGAGNAIRHPARTCNACHAKDDVHKGQNGTDCASCHNARSWKLTSFDHDRMTSFALKGKHRDAECQACHKQPPKIARLPVTCVACHAPDDVHKGGNGSECQRCHVETGWKITNFNHATMTRFPLLGKHAAVPCQSCHVRPAGEVRLAMDCASCHARDDVHAGRLGSNCARCHDSASFKANVRFDHDLSRFPLLGKHSQVACAGCHADRTFATHGTACADCHADKHHAGSLGTPAPCRNCHNTTDWRAWSFDHDRATQFALTGKHKGLICSACHARPGDPARLSTQCIACHRRNDVHRGGFGEDCQRCHVTDGFSQILMNAAKN